MKWASMGLFIFLALNSYRFPIHFLHISYICIYMCTHIYIYKYTHTHVYVYIYIYVSYISLRNYADLNVEEKARYEKDLQDLEMKALEEKCKRLTEVNEDERVAARLREEVLQAKPNEIVDLRGARLGSTVPSKPGRPMSLSLSLSLCLSLPLPI